MLLGGRDCALVVVVLPQEDVRRERCRGRREREGVIGRHNGQAWWIDRQGTRKRENRGTSMGEHERARRECVNEEREAGIKRG